VAGKKQLEKGVSPRFQGKIPNNPPNNAVKKRPKHRGKGGKNHPASNERKRKSRNPPRPHKDVKTARRKSAPSNEKGKNKGPATILTEKRPVRAVGGIRMNQLGL